MKDKVALVTGATGGIGLETALGLAKAGAAVLMVGRDSGRLETALALVKSKSGNASVEGFLADLSIQAQVRTLAAQVHERTDHLDILINNAGGWFGRREITEDGYERTWALNHLAYVLLSQQLIQILERSTDARVIYVASNLHAIGRLDFENLDGSVGYHSLRAYTQSKLANVMFTIAWARRLSGTAVSVNALHPGAVATGMGRDMARWMRWVNSVLRCFFISPARGAENSLFVATAPQMKGVSGKYVVRKRVSVPSPQAMNFDLQERLYELSLKQIAERGADHNHAHVP